MHATYQEIPSRLLESATGALAHANTLCAFVDPGNEHWGNLSVISAAHAGELTLKAIIATQHPLLIFKSVFDFDDNTSDTVQLETLISKARTHDFQHLPKALWAVNAERIPDIASFNRIRDLRNAIQHFFHPAGIGGIGIKARDAGMDFIYKNIDPLLHKHFGIFAVEFHEDHNVGYDYLVSAIISRRLKFSIPENFDLTEIDITECLDGAPEHYTTWFKGELERVGRLDLLTI